MIEALRMPDWSPSDQDADDDESHPPQFNEYAFGIGMEGDDNEDESEG